MAEITVDVGVRLKAMQSSITDLQKVLDGLQPNSSGFKALQKIIADISRDMDKLKIQTSKPFGSQNQFNQTEKTVDKLEESLERVKITIDKIKFSDLKLDSSQITQLDNFKQQLNDIKKEFTDFKAGLKGQFLDNDFNKVFVEGINPNLINKSFDEIIKNVNSKVDSLGSALAKAKTELENFQNATKIGEKLNKATNGIVSQDFMGQDLFNKFFQTNSKGIFSFKTGGSLKKGEIQQQFLEYLTGEFQLTQTQIDQLKNQTASGIRKILEQDDFFNPQKKAAETAGKKMSGADSNFTTASKNYENAAAVVARLNPLIAALTNEETSLENKQKLVNQAIKQFEQDCVNGAKGSKTMDTALNGLDSQLSSFKTQLSQVNAQWLNLQKQQATFNFMKSAIVNFMGFNQVLNLTKKAVKEAMDHIKQLDTTMNGIAIVTNMTTADLWKQVDVYSEMAQRYGTSIQGAYEVSKIYYQAGYETNEVLTLMNETLKMSKISGFDYATTTDYMMNAIKGFKMEVTDAASVVDVYSALAANTAVSQQELAEAMSKTASSMAGVGSTFEDTSAMIATMVSVTRESANNIGSAMKSIASRYGELTKDPTKLLDAEGEAMSFNKVDAALKSVGITLQTTDHQFRDFTDVIVELAEKWDTLDSAQQRYIATQFAGNRQQNRFLALVSNKDLLQENMEVAAVSEDTGTLQALKALDSLESKLNQVRVAYQQFYTTIGIENVWKAFLDGTENVINTLNNLPKLFGKVPVGAIAVIYDIISLIKTVALNGLSEIVTIWQNNLHKTEQTNINTRPVGDKMIEGVLGGIKSRAGEIQAAFNNELQTQPTKGEIYKQEVTQQFQTIQNKYENPFYQATHIDEYKTELLSLIQTLKITGQSFDELKNKIKAGKFGEVNSIIQDTINSLNTEGTVVENLSDKWNNLKSSISNYIKNSKHLASDMNGFASALNMVGALINTTSRQGQIASGSLMSLSGAFRLGSVAVQAFQGTLNGIPWMAIAMGIISVINGLSTIIETPAEKLERLTKEAEELNNEAKKTKAEYNTLQRTVDKLDELKEKRYESAEAAEEYQNAVDELANQFPQLIAAFDKAGNIILDTTNSEKILTEAREKSKQAAYDAAKAEMEASKEALSGAKNKLANLQLGLNDTVPDNLNIIEKRRSNFFSENGSLMPSFMGGDFGRTGNDFESGIDEDNFIKELQDLAYDRAEQENDIWYFLYDYINEDITDLDGLKKYLSNAVKNNADNSGKYKELLDILNYSKSESTQNTEIQELLEQIKDPTFDLVKNADVLRKIYSDIEGVLGRTNLSENEKQYYQNAQEAFEPVIKQLNQVYTLNEAYEGNARAVVSAWQNATTNNGKAWEYLEESSQLSSLITKQIVTDIGDLDYEVAKEQQESDWREYERIIERFYSNLSPDNQELLNAMLSDTDNFSAQDIADKFNISEGSEMYKLLTNYYQEGADAIKERLQNNLSEKYQISDSDLDIEDTSFLNQYGQLIYSAEKTFTRNEEVYLQSILSEYQKLNEKGLSDKAEAFGQSSLKLFSEIQELPAETQKVLLATIRQNGLNTKEGIEAIIGSAKANPNLKDTEIIDDLQALEENLIENLSLSLQSATSDLAANWDNASKDIKKLTSGMSLKEVDDFIQKAEAAGIEVNYSDFKTSGDKLVLSSEIYTQYWKDYSAKMQENAKSWATKVKEASSIIDSLDTNAELDRWVTGSNGQKFLYERNQKTFEAIEALTGDAEGFYANPENVDANGRLTEIGKQALAAAVEAAGEQAEYYTWLIEQAEEEMTKSLEWAKGNYSSLMKNGKFSSDRGYDDKGFKLFDAFNVEEFNQYLRGDTSYDAIEESDLKLAVENARNGVSSFISTLLTKGVDKFNASDFAESGIEASTYEDMVKDLATIGQEGGMTYVDFVRKYYDLTGATVAEINAEVIKAMQMDGATSVTAQKQAFSDLNIVGNIISGTKEQINALATSMGNVDVETLIGKDLGNDQFELNITSEVENLLTQFGIIKQSIPTQLKNYSDTLNSAASMITKGTNDYAQMQEFTSKYEKALGLEKGSVDWRDLYKYDENVKAYMLSVGAFNRYAEAEGQILIDAGAIDEDVANILNNSTAQLASAVDIAGYLKSNRNLQSQKDLEKQLTNYYKETIDKNLKAPTAKRETILKNMVAANVKATMDALNNGGIEAVEEYSKFVEDRDLTQEEITAAYRYEVDQYKSELDTLTNLRTGDIVDLNSGLGKRLAEKGIIDGKGIVKSLSGLNDVINDYFNDIKNSEEANAKDINDARALLEQYQPDKLAESAAYSILKTTVSLQELTEYFTNIEDTETLDEILKNPAFAGLKEIAPGEYEAIDWTEYSKLFSDKIPENSQKYIDQYADFLQSEADKQPINNMLSLIPNMDKITYEQIASIAMLTEKNVDEVVSYMASNGDGSFSITLSSLSSLLGPEQSDEKIQEAYLKYIEGKTSNLASTVSDLISGKATTTQKADFKDSLSAILRQNYSIDEEALRKEAEETLKKEVKGQLSFKDIDKKTEELRAQQEELFKGMSDQEAEQLMTLISMGGKQAIKALEEKNLLQSFSDEQIKSILETKANNLQSALQEVDDANNVILNSYIERDGELAKAIRAAGGSVDPTTGLVTSIGNLVTAHNNLIWELWNEDQAAAQEYINNESALRRVSDNAKIAEGNKLRNSRMLEEMKEERMENAGQAAINNVLQGNISNYDEAQAFEEWISKATELGKRTDFINGAELAFTETELGEYNFTQEAYAEAVEKYRNGNKMAIIELLQTTGELTDDALVEMISAQLDSNIDNLDAFKDSYESLVEEIRDSSKRSQVQAKFAAKSIELTNRTKNAVNGISDLSNVSGDQLKALADALGDEVDFDSLVAELGATTQDGDTYNITAEKWDEVLEKYHLKMNNLGELIDTYSSGLDAVISYFSKGTVDQTDMEDFTKIFNSMTRQQKEWSDLFKFDEESKKYLLNSNAVIDYIEAYRKTLDALNISEEEIEARISAATESLLGSNLDIAKYMSGEKTAKDTKQFKNSLKNALTVSSASNYMNKAADLRKDDIDAQKISEEELIEELLEADVNRLFDAINESTEKALEVAKELNITDPAQLKAIAEANMNKYKVNAKALQNLTIGSYVGVDTELAKRLKELAGEGIVDESGYISNIENATELIEIAFNDYINKWVSEANSVASVFEAEKTRIAHTNKNIDAQKSMLGKSSFSINDILDFYATTINSTDKAREFLGYSKNGENEWELQDPNKLAEAIAAGGLIEVSPGQYEIGSWNAYRNVFLKDIPENSREYIEAYTSYLEAEANKDLTSNMISMLPDIHNLSLMQIQTLATITGRTVASIKELLTDNGDQTYDGTALLQALDIDKNSEAWQKAWVEHVESSMSGFSSGVIGLIQDTATDSQKIELKSNLENFLKEQRYNEYEAIAERNLISEEDFANALESYTTEDAEKILEQLAQGGEVALKAIQENGLAQYFTDSEIEEIYASEFTKYQNAANLLADGLQVGQIVANEATREILAATGQVKFDENGVIVALGDMTQAWQDVYAEMKVTTGETAKALNDTYIKLIDSNLAKDSAATSILSSASGFNREALKNLFDSVNAHLDMILDENGEVILSWANVIERTGLNSYKIKTGQWDAYLAKMENLIGHKIDRTTQEYFEMRAQFLSDEVSNNLDNTIASVIPNMSHLDATTLAKLADVLGEESIDEFITKIGGIQADGTYNVSSYLMDYIDKLDTISPLIKNALETLLNNAISDLSDFSVGKVVSDSTANILSKNASFAAELSSKGQITIDSIQEYQRAVSEIFNTAKDSFKKGIGSLANINNLLAEKIQSNFIDDNAINNIVSTGNKINITDLANFFNTFNLSMEEYIDESGQILEDIGLENIGGGNYAINDLKTFLANIPATIDIKSTEFIDAYIALLDNEFKAPDAKEALMTSLVPNLERLSYAQVGQIAKMFDLTVDQVLAMLENNGDNTFNANALLNELDFDKNNEEYQRALKDQYASITENITQEMISFVEAGADGKRTALDFTALDNAISDYEKALQALGIDASINVSNLRVALIKGGEEAVVAAQEIAKFGGTELSSQDIETLYRGSIEKYIEAIDTIAAKPGEIVDQTTARLIQSAGGKVNELGTTGQYVVESAANLYEAYNKLLNKMVETGEATLADLNKVAALALENRDGEQQIIDALGDAAGMTFTRFGEILADAGIRLTEDMVDNLEAAGIIDLMGGNKMRIMDFKAFADLMHWDANSEEYVSAFKSYNDSLIEMNRQAERNILEEAQNVANAKGGDWINLTQLMDSLQEKFKYEGSERISLADSLTASIQKFGAQIENGILKLDDSANIPAIMQEIAQAAVKSGGLLSNELAELADTVADAIKGYADLISGAIGGSLSNVQAEQLQDWADSVGIGKLDFTETQDGLKVATDQAFELVAALQQVDSMQGRLTFDNLVDSLSADKGGQFANISKTTAEIANKRREIAKVSEDIAAIEKRSAENQGQISNADKEKLISLREQKKELNDQLNLYTQIQQRQSIDPAQYNFMDRDIPDVMQGPVNYWNSVGKAFAAMNEAGKTGRMEVQDFYNIVTEMENLANTSNQVFELAGYQIGGSASQAAKLIQDGMLALDNVDGKGVMINLQELGINFADGAEGAKQNFADGVNALADSQIAMLDAAIKVLEVVVAMEQLGNIDVENKGTLDLGEIFNIDENTDEITGFAADYAKWADNIYDITHDSKAANFNKDLAEGLESISINGNTMKDLIYAASKGVKEGAKAFEDLGMSEKKYQTIINSFYQAMLNGDYNLDTIQQSVWDILNQTLPDGTVIEVGDRTIVISGGSHFEINWKSETTQEALQRLTGKEKNYTDEDRKNLQESLERYYSGQSLDNIDIETGLIFNGKIKLIEGKKVITDPKGREITEDEEGYEQALEANTLADLTGQNLEDITYDGEIPTTTITYPNNIETKITYTQEKGIQYWGPNGEGPYDSEDDMFNALYEKAITEFIGNEVAASQEYARASAKNTYTKEMFLYETFGIRVRVGEVSVTNENGDKVDPSTNPEMRRKLKEALNTNIADSVTEENVVDLKNGKIKVSFEGIGDIEVDKVEGEDFHDTAQRAIMEALGVDESLVENITTAITNAFTSTDGENGNAVQTAITTAITNAFTQLKDIPPQEIPEVTAKITNLKITGVSNTSFGGNDWLSGAANTINKAVKGGADIVIPSATAKVSALKLTEADEVDTTTFETLGEQIAEAIQKGLTATPVVPNIQLGGVTGGEGPGDDNNNNNNNTSSLFTSIGEISDAIGKISDTFSTAAGQISDLAKAADNISNQKVLDIQTAQDEISTGKIEAVKKAINGIGGTVSLGVKINVETGPAPAKGTIGSISTSPGYPVRSGASAFTWKQNHAYAAGKTLMGELGPELVVSHGRYFLVGQAGPEMVNLDQDAIVFNHLQTKKLMSQGKIGSRGTPITNERVATSFATGNVDGPAMASASEALSVLKQLKSMWESLQKASLKDLGAMAGAGGGGGGGGGGNNAADIASIVKDVEEWYNWMVEIEEAQHNLNKLAKDYSLLEAQGASNAEKIANLQKQALELARQRNTQEQLRQKQIAKRNALIERDVNQGPLGLFYKADEAGKLRLTNDQEFSNYMQQFSPQFAAQFQTTGKAMVPITVAEKYSPQEAEEYNRKNKKKIDAGKMEAVSAGQVKEGGRRQEMLAEIPAGGLALLAELQKIENGNPVYDAQSQFQILEALGLRDLMMTDASGKNIDTSQENWVEEAVQNAYDKLDTLKGSIDGLTDSADDLELEIKDADIQLQEWNNDIKEMVRPMQGVVDVLDSWYDWDQRLITTQNRLNLVTAKYQGLQQLATTSTSELISSLRDSIHYKNNYIKETEGKVQKQEEKRAEMYAEFANSGLNQKGILALDDNGRIVPRTHDNAFAANFSNVNPETLTATIGLTRFKEIVDEFGNYILDGNGLIQTQEETFYENFDVSNFSNFVKQLTAVDAFGNSKYTLPQQVEAIKASGFAEDLQRINGVTYFDSIETATEEELEKAIEAYLKYSNEFMDKYNTHVNEQEQEIINLQNANNEVVKYNQQILELSRRQNGVTESLERWYNLSREIVALQNQLNLATTKYDNLTKELGDNSGKIIENLNEQSQYLTETLAATTKKVKEMEKDLKRTKKELIEKDGMFFADNGENGVKYAEGSQLQDFVRENGSAKVKGNGQVAFHIDKTQLLMENGKYVKDEDGAYVEDKKTTKQRVEFDLSDIGKFISDLTYVDAQGIGAYSWKDQAQILHELGFDQQIAEFSGYQSLEGLSPDQLREAVESYIKHLQDAPEAVNETADALQKAKEEAAQTEGKILDINNKIRETLKPTQGVTKHLEAWYQWTRQTAVAQNELNKLQAEYNNLQKRQQLGEGVNEADLAANLKMQSEQTQLQKEAAEERLKAQEAERANLVDQIKSTPALNKVFTTNKNGDLVYNTKALRGNKDTTIKVDEIARDEEGHEIRLDKNNKEIRYNEKGYNDKTNRVATKTAEYKFSDIFGEDVLEGGITPQELVDTLTATDATGNAIHSLELQMAVLNKMGITGQELVAFSNGAFENWDEATEEQRLEAVSNYLNSLPDTAEKVNGLNDAIAEEKTNLVNLDNEIADYNLQLKELAKISVGIQNPFEEYFTWIQKVKQEQNELNLLTKEYNVLEKERVANGREIGESLLEQIESYEQQQKTNQEYLDARKKDYDELMNQENWTNAQKQFFNVEDGQLQYNDSEFKKRVKNKNGITLTGGKDANGVYNYKAISEGINFSASGMEDFIAKLTEQNADNSMKYNADQQFEILKAFGFEDLMQYDSQGNPIFANGIENATKEERAAAVKAVLENLKAFQDKANDAADGIQSLEENSYDLTSNIIDIKNQLQDNEIELENKVLQAIEDRQQAEIDALHDQRDILSAAADKFIDGLSKQLDKERSMYEKQESQDELNQLQRQLAILQRSGGSASQIRSLQDQIRSQQKDMYFDERQEQIDAIKEASDAELERLDHQIEVMEETLAYNKENGLYWEEVRQIMAGSTESIMQFLELNLAELKSQSTLQKEKSIVEEEKSVSTYTNTRKKYASGGLIDYTGPAWVDGSYSSPEAILNSDQTKFLREQFLESLQSFSLAISDINQSLLQRNILDSIGDNSGIKIEQLDFVMQVGSIANDYDARRAGQQAFEEMVRIARKSGNRSVSRR